MNRSLNHFMGMEIDTRSAQYPASSANRTTETSTPLSKKRNTSSKIGLSYGEDRSVFAKQSAKSFQRDLYRGRLPLRGERRDGTSRLAHTHA